MKLEADCQEAINARFACMKKTARLCFVIPGLESDPFQCETHFKKGKTNNANAFAAKMT